MSIFECKISLPEIKDFIKDLVLVPENIFKLIRRDIKDPIGKFLTKMMEVELTIFLGRLKYERIKGKRERNYRNGYTTKTFAIKGIGGIRVQVPRDRLGKFNSRIIPKYKRQEEELSRDISLLFLTGLSTRTLSMLSKHLLGYKISHSQVSNCTKELKEAIERWRNRDLSREKIKYLFVDGVNFKIRIGNSIESLPILVAIGVNDKGIKKVLGFQMGDKESASSWREFFKDLKSRGLKGSDIKLGVMDGLSGLERVFKEEFINSKIQRCLVHVMRNVLYKVPKKYKKEVADALRDIFYAASKKESYELFMKFKQKWEKIIPSAVRSLEKSFKYCTTFYSFPYEEWVSIRSTNIIERLHKEFKRRTKSMEIIGGEKSCYLLLSFISLKMELYWQSHPIGMMQNSLINLKNINKIFTQNS